MQTIISCIIVSVVRLGKKKPAQSGLTIRILAIKRCSTFQILLEIQQGLSAQLLDS